MRQLELLEKLLLVVQFELGIEHLIHGHAALDDAGDVVDILRLDERLEVVLEHLGEVVLQLGAAEVLENLLPIWRILAASLSQTCKHAEIGRSSRHISQD